MEDGKGRFVTSGNVRTVRVRTVAYFTVHFTEADFTPRYACTKCSDTGFLPDGKMCDCYKGS